jgi:hypothetical protein
MAEKNLGRDGRTERACRPISHSLSLPRCWAKRGFSGVRNETVRNVRPESLILRRVTDESRANGILFEQIVASDC